MRELGQLQKEAFAQVLITHALLTRIIDKALTDEGFVSLQVYDVLLALEDAPGQRLRMIDLAERMVFSPSGLTRLIDRLVEAGWVDREANLKDRRSVYAVLTPAGLAERERTWPRYRELIQEQFGQYLSDRAAKAVRDGLAKTTPQARQGEGSPARRTPSVQSPPS
ncbi:MAG TPA: MarR family transcriptional regulator [Fimbriimonadaceae bacterium]|nr:MarR family transcriptional regulator [Fimbriimonadaceae bacterium]HRJ32285.1 MarR family transcriptional regulator [Fimbriimonadaceae bacterium]